VSNCWGTKLKRNETTRRKQKGTTQTRRCSFCLGRCTHAKAARPPQPLALVADTRGALAVVVIPTMHFVSDGELVYLQHDEAEEEEQEEEEEGDCAQMNARFTQGFHAGANGTS